MSHNNGKVSVISAGAQSQIPESPTRIPKLLVRDPVDQDAITPAQNSPAIGSNSSDGRRSNDHHSSSQNAPNTAILHNHAWHDGSPKTPNKDEKRKRGVMSFFSLKEPSTSAWEEFVQQQKDDAALRGVNSPALTNKKLPDNVPKVNSKWDGLPNVARSRSNTGSSWKRSAETTPPASKRSEDVQFGGSPSDGRGHTAAKTRSSNTSAFSRAAPSTSASSSGHIRGYSGQSTTRSAVGKSDNVVGPLMSTESMTKDDPTGDLSDFSSVPILSLFFPDTSNTSDSQSQEILAHEPSDPTPTYRSRSASDIVNRGPHSAEDSSSSMKPEQTTSSEAPIGSRSPEQSNITIRSLTSHTQSQRIASTDLSPERSGDPGKSASAPVLRAVEEPAQAPNVPNYERRRYDSSSESTAGSSPYNPPTPEALTPTISTKRREHPAVLHSRKRSTDDSPQWPLASSAKPTAQSDDSPAIPPRSPRRTSASSQEEILGNQERSGIESDDERLFLDGLIPQSSTQMSQQNSVRGSVRSFSRPLLVSPQSSVRSSPGRSSPGDGPMGTISIVRNNQTYTPSSFRAPPAMLPGRVVTKDSDLATIPESDTTSVRTLSVHQGKTGNGADKSLRTTMYLSDTDESDDDDADDADTDTGAEKYEVPQAVAGAVEPRRPKTPPPPSQPLEDWRKSPRERLGLGGLIRRNDGSGASTLWAPDTDGEDSGTGAVDNAKRSGLKAVFRRG